MYKEFDLRLFSEGAAEGAPEGKNSSAENNIPVAGEESQNNQVAPEETFEDLIKGKYKKDFETKVKDVISKRLKNSREAEDRLSKMNVMLEVLGSRYGIDTSDINNIDYDRLASQIEEDNSYYEEEALEKGLDVETLKQIKKMERENNRLRQIMAEKTRQEKTMQEWQNIVVKSEEVKERYPEFNLETEMENPTFAKLVANGISPMNAYQSLHYDEIQERILKQAAQKTTEKISNAVQSNLNRPAENGINSAPASETKLDPRNLTKQQREEIRRRVARGEKISF